MDDSFDVLSGHTFRIWTLPELFRKLHRERGRFLAAEDGDLRDQVDSVINFAITAWHMTDWAWERHEPKMRAISSASGKPEFQAYMRRQSSQLAACDIIANAFKHGGLAYDMADRPRLETVLSPQRRVSFNAPPSAPMQWTLKMLIDGRHEHAGDVLSRVFVFWHAFLQAHCLHVGR